MQDQLIVTRLLEEHGAQCPQGLNSSEFAKMMDANDPLSSYRHLFHYPKKSTLPHHDPTVSGEDENAIYLCGHSLGLCPRKADEMIQTEMRKWHERGILGYFTGELPWKTVGEGPVLDQMGELVGAKEGEVVLMNSLTANLHFLMVSFYRPTPQRHKILVEGGLFPSDLVAVRSQIELHDLDPETSLLYVHPRTGENVLRADDIIKTINEHGDEIALVMFSGVQFFTGQCFDMAEITRAGHTKGCLVGFDLAHAVGNVTLKLHDWAVDFAAWCSYKYLNGGPGGVAAAFVHEKHFHDSSIKRMNGWWGIKTIERFEMEPNNLPFRNNALAYVVSCPPVMSVLPLMASLEIMCSAGMDKLRQKQTLLTGYLEFLLHSNIDLSSFEILTPSNPRDRGCQLSIRFNSNLDDIFKELQRRGVVCDVRRSELIRVAPVPLYNSFMDVYNFVMILKHVTAQFDLGLCTLQEQINNDNY